MDNLTHTLVALTLARSGLRRAGRGTTATLLIASNAPDIDIVAAFVAGETAYLAAHRGPTHGPLGVVGLGVASALMVCAWLRRPGRSRFPASPERRLVPLSALGIVGTSLHVLMDLPTSYGIRLLSPFVTTWFAFDWLPIIDIYMWIALAAGLTALSMNPGARRYVLRAVLIVLLANYALRAITHHLALERAPEPAPSPLALERWSAEPDAAKLAPCGPEYHGRGFPKPRCSAVAIPRFLSPFQWMIVRRQPDGYELSSVDLLRPNQPRTSVRVASQPDVWAMSALNGRVSRVFMGFARLPSVATDPAGPGVVVRFQDLRFVRSLRPETPPDLRTGPFVASIRLDFRGSIVNEHLGE